jgi:hypothetical protein
MTIKEFADVLRHPNTRLAESGTYISKRTGRQGYWAHLEAHDRWYWYSVSSTLQDVSPLAVADAVTSPKCRVDRSEPYKNGKGFEATVRLGGHSYMLGHGSNRPPIST